MVRKRVALPMFGFWACLIAARDRSTFQCLIYASDQCVHVKRLFEEAGRSAGTGLGFEIGVGARRDHDDGNRAPPRGKFVLEFDPTHTRHLKIGDDTGKLRARGGRKEIFCRRKALAIKSYRSQQPDQSDAQWLIVIDDCNLDCVRHTTPFRAILCAANNPTVRRSRSHVVERIGHHTQVLAE
jgi:hypothetical protein